MAGVKKMSEIPADEVISLPAASARPQEAGSEPRGGRLLKEARVEMDRQPRKHVQKSDPDGANQTDRV